MHLLMLCKKHLPIGSEGWKGVAPEHKIHFPGWGRSAPARKFSTLAQRQIPTGDPDCPEEVKLARRVKCVTGSKAAVLGDAEDQESNLEEVEFGEN